MCECCNGVVSTMTAMGNIPLGGSLLLNAEEYTAIQLSPGYPDYMTAAVNEKETAYIQDAADVCCPKLLAHVISPIRCASTPANNYLTSDIATVSFECLKDSEAKAAAFDWKGGCADMQFERKVIVGPCCVYPDGDGVPDSYKQSWSAAHTSSTLKCWQRYESTSTYYYNGTSSMMMHNCGVTETNSCGSFTGTYYSCDYYNSDEGTLIPVDMGTPDLWTVLYAQVAASCGKYSCHGTPFVWTDNYHGWCYAITCCKKCDSYSVSTSNYTMMKNQNSECYSCGDTCRWQCGDYQSSCYQWLNNCAQYGSCPAACPDTCIFDESSSSSN